MLIKIMEGVGAADTFAFNNKAYIKYIEIPDLTWLKVISFTDVWQQFIRYFNSVWTKID